MNNFFRPGFLRVAAPVAVAAALLAGGLGVAKAGGMEPDSDPAHVNGYVGIGFGPQVKTGCSGADTCESGGTAWKIFGGYRFTPSLATEISYYYLGAQERSWANTNSNRPSYSFVNGSNTLQNDPVGKEKATTQALGIGLALESEMFPNIFSGRFVQHLRVGLAASRVKKELTVEGKSGQYKAETQKNRVFPYVGAGLSYSLSPRMKVFTSADALINPDRKHFVLTFGGGGEF